MNVTVAREPGELDVLQWTALHSVGHPLYTGQTPPVPQAVCTHRPAVAEVCSAKSVIPESRFVNSIGITNFVEVTGRSV